ncbi:MAG TPA: response regulator [Pyrinomonadaceae bacterium]|jgi:DNA-binding NtrC family response regulator|nr:response regulator [Pyrinomonadaceae bacterium]
MIETNRELTGLPTGTERILLVDDEEAVRDSTSEILELCGYQVIQAKNGYEAISVYENEGDNIDLVITDVVMPRMGGESLVNYLSFTHPQKRVLYMSGYTGNIMGNQDVPASSANFIQKPFTLEDLAQKVREVLDSSQA